MATPFQIFSYHRVAVQIVITSFDFCGVRENEIGCLSEVASLSTCSKLYHFL